MYAASYTVKLWNYICRETKSPLLKDIYKHAYIYTYIYMLYNQNTVSFVSLFLARQILYTMKFLWYKGFEISQRYSWKHYLWISTVQYQ